ncbi:MFS transporter [Clostridium sp. KNHs205]|uniref:MFS transporter n=1 Tax=Clostridium sp. KNHs205 TaxID=1449050 RepID=UPI0009DEDC7F|nr:MFS transporter [Clostridium sp. KNHs205]
MKIKLTRLEKSWVLYDVGNSAFTLLVSTIIPIYFDYLAEQQNLSSVSYLAFWGYAVSIATLLVALSGPALGTISDSEGLKKPIFLGSILLGAISCVALGLATAWLMFLIVFVLAKVAYSSSLIFYDSMLPDITTEERMDTVSAQGFAWGYIGSCIPFIACLGLVMGGDSLGLTLQQSMAISFGLVALWWVLNSLPFLKKYKQVHSAPRRKHAVADSFKSLFRTIKNIRKEAEIFWFLLAFFFYIDGVYTIIDMATAYGKALGLDSTGLLLALLLTQFVAFPCCILFGRLSARISSDKLITVCIMAYLGITIFAVFMNQQLHFWILAVLVGMFQGGIQALSRSYFAKIIPAEKAGEYFGIMDICGKGASFLGTALVSVISQLTGSINKGVGAIAILFVIGILLFRKAISMRSNTSDNDNTIDEDICLQEQKI